MLTTVIRTCRVASKMGLCPLDWKKLSHPTRDISFCKAPGIHKFGERNLYCINQSLVVMNATLINTAPNHVLDQGDRLQAPVTPRRKLQIPSVFASSSSSTPGKIPKKEPYTPGKLKIPAAFSDLKTLKSLCLHDSADDPTFTESAEKQTQEPVSTNKAEEPPEKDEPAEQLVEETVPVSDPESVSPEASSPESKPKRKVRKQRSKTPTSKEQLLAEIAALEKEISKAAKLKPDSNVSKPEESRPETKDASPLPNEPEARLFVLPDEPKRPFERKDSGAGDSLVVLESESTDIDTDGAFGRDMEVAGSSSLVETVVVNKVDARSIQSPRTKIKTLKKLRSFFRRKKSRKSKSDSSMNPTDCLV